MLRLIGYTVVFLLGAAAGGMAAGYADQYEREIEARLGQVTIDLDPFQEIADQYHGGSLAALVEHHLASSDPTFFAEGEAIGRMIRSRADLDSAHAALSGKSVPGRVLFVIRNADREIVRPAWSAYSPALVTTREAFGFAIYAGLALMLAAYLSITVLRRVFSARRAANG